MLKEELTEHDIPSSSTIRACVIETLNEYLKYLAKEMKVMLQ